MFAAFMQLFLYIFSVLVGIRVFLLCKQFQILPQGKKFVKWLDSG
jgi:hypothetical protein